ncbi:alpha/beta hydrolase [Amedibacillus sp. YH-ame6]
MMKNEFSLASKVDGLSLSGCYVESSVTLRGVIYLVHGMSEHKERYLEFMEYLAQHGFTCVIMDTRGHGQSVKSDDDLGFFYDDEGSHCVEDVHHMISMIKQKVNVPVILFGHSMGSLIVRAYTKKYDDEIDVLVVCGSPSKNPMASIAFKLVGFISVFKGDHHRSKFIHNMVFSSFGKRFNEDFSENNWLSANKENVHTYDKDAYSGFIFTLNGFKNLFHLMKIAYDEKGWGMKNAHLPILFVAGKDDPCIDTVEKFKEAYTFLQQRGYKDVSSHLFEGMRHEILNETQRKEVFDYIVEWLDGCIGS